MLAVALSLPQHTVALLPGSFAQAPPISAGQNCRQFPVRKLPPAATFKHVQLYHDVPWYKWGLMRIDVAHVSTICALKPGLLGNFGLLCHLCWCLAWLRFVRCHCREAAQKLGWPQAVHVSKDWTNLKRTRYMKQWHKRHHTKLHTIDTQFIWLQ